MEENPINLSDFEALLQNQSNKRTAMIYSDGANQKDSSTCLCTAKDVLTNIAETMKAIQNADCVRLDRNVRKTLVQVQNKRSQFLSVNMLQISKEESGLSAPTTNQFDTQCVGATQLLDVIDKAEGLHVEGGMTQEFETTFCVPLEDAAALDRVMNETDEVVKASPELASKVDIIEQTKPQTDLPQKSNSDIEQTICTENLNGSQSKENVYDTILKDEPALLRRNKTEILNESIDIEPSLENPRVLIVEEVTERPVSPVLKTIVQTKKPILSQHLVVDLEQFENFEAIAAQLLIAENVDLNTAKALINAQILNKEVRSLPEIDRQPSEEERCSPILETKYLNKQFPENIEKYETEEVLEMSQILISKTALAPVVASKTKEIGAFSKSELEIDTYYGNKKDYPLLKDRSETNECEEFSKLEHGIDTVRSATPLLRPTSVASENKLEDEILFSSDEEEDYIHKNIQELPFSIALETSFYTNQSDILDRTMYVGFQTASNKSIQISVDSYDKAKNALEQFSLKDLVKTCTGSVHVEKNNKDYGIKETELKNMDEIGLDKDVCFKTSSGKNIDISKEGMLKSNAVFKDLDTELAEQVQIDMKYQDLTNIPVKDNNKGETLEKVENVLKDIDLSDIFDTDTKTVQREKEKIPVVCSNNVMLPIPKNKQFEGFKTASNKNINISEKALQKSHKIFQDIDKLHGENITEVCSPKNNSTKTLDSNSEICHGPLRKGAKHDFKDISSVSNNKIHISDKAIPELDDVFLGYLGIEEINQDIGLLDEFRTESDEIVKNVKIKDHINKIDDKLLKTEKNSAFVGFKTASDKQINISEQAMAESMRVFQDIDSVHKGVNDRADITKAEEFGLFNTASNKKIKVSDDALAKTKSVFSDISDLNEPKSQDIPILKGFRTASKKPVIISKEAMEKTKNIFQDIDCLNTTEHFGKDMVPEFVGFQTASKKRVVISKEALEKSKHILQDIDKPIEKPETESEPVFQGFQTASKKPVVVSKEALEKTKNIFQDIDQVEITTDDQKLKSEHRFKKPVITPKEALKKTKSLCQDIDKPDKIHIKDLETKSESHVMGFKTASNMPLTISKEALERTRNIFKDLDKDENIPQFQAFRTASNKNVHVSSEALERSKKLFEDMPELIDAVICKNTAYERTNKSVTNNRDTLPKSKVLNDLNHSGDLVQESGKFCGFQTASKKAVIISAKALARTRNIFQDINFDDDADVPTFEGFKTGGKTKVGVSEEALVMTKILFNDNNEVITAKKTNFLGFQTASNKKVEVSEDALAKTKEIFKDFEMSQSMEPKFLNPQISGFKSGHDTAVLTSNEALVQSKSALANMADLKHVTTNSIQKQPENLKHNSMVEEMELNKIIDTQVLHNFEEALNTEDFCPNTPKITRKRSGSPILSCPKAKKRKTFKTPYKIDSKFETPVKEPTVVAAKHCNTVKFDENYKKQKCYTLKTIQQLEMDSKEEIRTDPYVLQFKFDDLLQFEFVRERNNLNSNESLTIEELKIHFEESVSKKIIPEGWFENHTKLIIWKLICYEIRFPRTMSNMCNAKTVIDQLKYRYDRELYKVERPALRKILERDDVSTRTMILCVVSIFADGEDVTSVVNADSTIELLVTDGWYCVRACTDRMLARLVCERKITVGCKLATHGAELLNCEQGIAPWEDTSKVRLKLAGNSTRRARWDARLGRHGNAAILCHLSSVRADGGKLAKTRVLVTRVYPLLYVEKFADGSTVTRSERLEQIYQMKYEADRQIQLEKLYEDIEKEFSDAESQDSDVELGSGKRRCMESGSQIAKMMKRSKDPAEFRSTLTESQQRLLADHSTRAREKLLEAIQARVQEKLVQSGLDLTRNVVTLLKIRVAGVCEKNGVLEITKGLMSIWRPNDAILEILQEGAWVDVMDVVPTALRYSELQLSAGRQSTFDKAKVEENAKLKAVCKSLSRKCTSIKDLTRNPQSSHEYNEIDTVGIVIDIDPSKIDFEKESIRNRHLFQNVFLADSERNIICVNFWGGLKKFGFENVLDTGQVIVGANLQKRAGNTRKNIPQYRATEFTYFTKTPKSLTAREMVEELVKKFQGIDRRKFCQECVQRKNCMAVTSQNNTENVSPYRFNNTDYNLSKNKIYIESPLAQKPARIEDLNLTGLDFESTFKHRDTQDLSPKELERKQRVRQKMAKLKMYGEPPPISPIHIINKSVNARSDYKSPLLAKLPQENPKTTPNRRNYQNGVGVARFPSNNVPNSVEKSKERNLSEITSPLVSMNRTYVKYVNPVKLNFSNIVTTEENSVSFDHFAEEFDDSPPLSLD